jgi:hypothetical protein
MRCGRRTHELRYAISLKLALGEDVRQHAHRVVMSPSALALLLSDPVQ